MWSHRAQYIRGSPRIGATFRDIPYIPICLGILRQYVHCFRTPHGFRIPMAMRKVTVEKSQSVYSAFISHCF